MKSYIFNLETTKIELHFEKSEYNALTVEQKADLKSTFLWNRTGSCWVSRAKEPNLWRAKQVAEKLGFAEELREGERISFSEQVERQVERAENRAERYEQYAANAERRGEQLQKPLENMHGDIAFFTQPNINSSAGRAFTNYRERLYARYHKGFEEYRKSDYFNNRAATARGTASQAQYDNPAYLDRRIKECKKEIRDREKNIIYYEEILFAIESGEEKRWRGGEVVTAENVKPLIAYELELVEKAMDKQGYLENCLDALGGVKFNKDNIKVGYMGKVLQFVNVGPGAHGYSPEMGDRKPCAQIEASLGHYGKHYYLDTPLELKGRGIKYIKTYTGRDLTAAGQHKVGWHSYLVTVRAYELLEKQYSISRESLLD